MVCRDGMHLFQWLSSGSTAAPAHLRCQCGRTKQGDLDELGALRAERDQLRAERDANSQEIQRAIASVDKASDLMDRMLVERDEALRLTARLRAALLGLSGGGLRRHCWCGRLPHTPECDQAHAALGDGQGDAG